MYYIIDDYRLILRATHKGISHIKIERLSDVASSDSPNMNNPHIKQCLKELEEYFLGQRQQFDIAIDLHTGTLFQQRVWHALLDIPYGDTWSYQDVAIHIDNPKAAQAIGQANKKNPLPIIIPCHRVIGKDGSLTGYMGNSEAGLTFKQLLLQLEKQK